MKKKIMGIVFIVIGILVAIYAIYSSVTDYIAYNNGKTITVYGSILNLIFDALGPLAYAVIFGIMGIGLGILFVVGGISTLRQPKAAVAE